MVTQLSAIGAVTVHPFGSGRALRSVERPSNCPATITRHSGRVGQRHRPLAAGLGEMADYAHSDHASRSREEKARRLAAYVWARGISGDELLELPAAQRRKLARAAET